MMIPACPLADLPRGEAFRLEIDPPVTVFHTEDGELFAIDDTCTHQDASLADGWVEDCWVECPLHASKFNLKTGEVDAPPAKLPVRTHEVVVENGMIYVQLATAAPNLPHCVARKLAGALT
jgi:3-phenylpropionate/trans-cinnamate dioxygenase ferredoxin subunit